MKPVPFSVLAGAGFEEMRENRGVFQVGAGLQRPPTWVAVITTSLFFLIANKKYPYGGIIATKSVKLVGKVNHTQ